MQDIPITDTGLLEKAGI